MSGRTATTHRAADDYAAFVPLITAAQAAEILGVDVQQVYNLASRGTITRHAPSHVRLAYDLEEIEASSLSRLKYQQGGRPHWLNVSEVADYLGVHDSRVRQLLDAERLPCVMAPNGRRYVRRHQLEVVANSRDVRAGIRPSPQ